jgi:hypothetical protein
MVQAKSCLRTWRATSEIQFSPVPVAKMLSKDLGKRRPRVDMDKAACKVLPSG